MKLVYKIE